MAGKSIGRVNIALGLDASGMRGGGADVKAALNDIGSEAKGLSPTFMALGGAVAAGLGVAMKAFDFLKDQVVAFTKSSIETGIAFSSEMSRVKALTRATAEEFSMLSEEAKRLGALTQFSAAEAAKGMGNLAAAGFSTQEIMKAIGGSLDLAAVGQIEIAEATQISAAVLRGMSIDASEAGHVMDVLATAASNSAQNITDLGEAFKYVAPFANLAGKDIHETGAAIMALADAGLRGSMGGTALRGFLTKSAQLTDSAKRAMEELDISFEDAAGNFRHIADIVDDLKMKLQPLGRAKRLELLGGIFEARAAAGVAALIDRGGAALRDFERDLRSSDGAAREMGRTLTDNLGGDIERLKSSIDGVKLSFFEGIRDPVRDVTEEMIKFFDTSDAGFKRMGSAAGDLVVAIRDITVGIREMGRAITQAAEDTGLTGFLRRIGADAFLEGGRRAPSPLMMFGGLGMVADLWRMWGATVEGAPQIEDLSPGPWAHILSLAMMRREKETRMPNTWAVAGEIADEMAAGRGFWTNIKDMARDMKMHGDWEDSLLAGPFGGFLDRMKDAARQTVIGMDDAAQRSMIRGKPTGGPAAIERGSMEAARALLAFERQLTGGGGTVEEKQLAEQQKGNAFLRDIKDGVKNNPIGVLHFGVGGGL